MTDELQQSGITLNVQEVLTSLNVVQQEAQKWITVSNTLSKCAAFINSLLEQQKQQEATDKVEPDPGAPGH